MSPIGTVDLTGWEPILDKHGVTPEKINDDTGDPNDFGAVTRRAIEHANQNVPYIYRHALVDDPQVLAWADTLLAEASGRIVPSISHGASLLLLGVTGVGKTYQAFGALRYMTPTGVKVPWTAVSSVDLYGALRYRNGVDSEAEFWKYAKAPVLFVDDLGAERKPTEFVEEVNFRLVNHRYQNQLPTLFTSNVLPKDLAGRVGDRVASRITEMCNRVVIKGADRRYELKAAA